MKLHQPQREVARSKDRFRVVNCGRRWGKTTLAVEEMKATAIYKSDARVAYIAPTYQQARDIAWSTLKKELRDISIRINESRLEVEVQNTHGGTSLIILRGWEAIETLRGQFFDFIVIDEVASMRNFQLNWQEVLVPTLTDRTGKVLFISTPKGFNHFYELYNKYTSFHFTSYDNPFLKPEEIEEYRKEMTETRFAQEYLADFKKAEGLVYPEFDRKKHVTEEEPTNIKTIALGIDWGFTNPACILKVIQDHDNNFYISEEWYKTKQTTDQIVQKALSYNPNEVYPDSAEPDRNLELINAGLNVREVNKDIAGGVDKVRELIKQNRIKVHPRCENFIREIEQYRYPERGVDYNSRIDLNEKEVPVKEMDHAMDCLRYILFTIEPARQLTIKTKY